MLTISPRAPEMNEAVYKNGRAAIMGPGINGAVVCLHCLCYVSDVLFRTIPTLLCLGLFSVCSTHAQQQKPTAHIAIEVQDMSGAPIPKAHVEVFGVFAKPVKKVEADEDGKLSIDLPIGTYEVAASYPAFKSAKKRIEVQEPTNQTVTFLLNVAVGGPTVEIFPPDSKLVCLEIKKRGADHAPSGPGCVDQQFVEYGTPVMFSVNGKVVSGVSVRPDKPTYLYLWMDNQSDETEFHYFCCGKIFWNHVVDVYDAQGNRVPSKIEQAAQAGNYLLESCTCSGYRPVPPHTLMVVDSGDLLEDFQLAPDRYVIFAAKPSATTVDLHTSLQITVP